MRNHSRAVVTAGVVLAAVSFVLAWQRQAISSQATPAPALLDESVVSFRVQFGLSDREPRAWDGRLSVAGGELSGLRNWRPRPEDRVEGSSWSLATRSGVNFALRAWDTPRPQGAASYLLIPGVIVDVKSRSGTTVRFETRNGSFEVAPAALSSGSERRFLDGAVAVDRVPAAQSLSDAGSNSDFAALTAGANGELWAAWVAFRDRRQQVEMRHFDGRAWSAARPVSGDHRDIFLVKTARDGGGRVWFVWSAQIDGNWDLHARSWDGKAFSPVERLTSAAQPDIYHNLSADSQGNLWLVWQGFRQGASDIFARRWDGTAWSAEEKLSPSPANDWEPAIAADGDGRVWVAWDTYDQGNYDIVMRKHENGRWSELATVAATPRFEAHVSLACDSGGRLWAAWNETGFEWGKDTGFLIKVEGTRLYHSRSIEVAVFDGGTWKQPASIESSLPEDLRGYNDLPALVADSAGRVWLFFRHRLLRIRDTPSDSPAHRAAWEVFATAYEGDRWTQPIALPFSQGRTDMRGGFAGDGRGNVYGAWPMDNRNYEDFLYQRAEVYAARIAAPPGVVLEPRLETRTTPRLTAFRVHESESADLARIRGYQIRSGGRTYKIYRGDTHRHTEFSMDGNNDGSLLDAYRYALDAASLDYLGVSEHNGAGGPDNDYINWLLQQAVDLFTIAGNFVPVYAYERSVGYPNGHRNVLFARRGNPTLAIPVEEQKAVAGARSLYQYLKKYNGIAISHTSATNMGTDWRDNDPEVEPLVEIYQGDRVSAEYEGAPKAALTGKPSSAPGGFRPAGYVWNAWAKGYKLGVQVSSDHLSTHLSYACTLATEFTRDGLLDGMRARHSYGATENIILDYRLETGGREYIQGDIVKAAGPFKLLVRVIGTAPVRQIDIVRNNVFLHTWHPMLAEVNLTYADTDPPAGESYYYVRVIQADDEIAWSSPIWVTRP